MPESAVHVLRDPADVSDESAALRESEERYRTLFTNMTEGFALGEAICDGTGAPCDFRFLEMNDAFERQSGLCRETARGRPMRELLPHLEPFWIDTYCDVALGGAPRHFERYNGDLGRHFSVYCFSPAPRRFAILFTDITERKRIDGALKESTTLLRAISDSSTDVIFAKALDGRIRFVNPATLALIGKPLDRVLGKTDAEFLDDKAAAAVVMENDRRVMAGGVTVEVEERVPLPDGTDRVWLSRKTPYRDSEGKVIGLLGISRDITARKQAEQALQESEERLREADRRKDEFIAILSHELRNPLAPIRFALPILERAPLEGAAQRAVGVIDRQINHMTRLVDDLLDASRISRGKLDLRMQRVTVGSIVTAAIEAAAPATSASRHQVKIALASEPIWVCADLARMTQVVTNLINNSAKYTPRGGCITVEGVREDDRAVIRVRDTGIGIPAEALESLFEMFQQIDRADQPQGGLGIGLALAKRLVDMHEGTIEARSAGVGQGAEFIVRLPAVQPAGASDDADVGGFQPARERLKVLIVDDNADLVDMLAEVVGELGHEVRKALDGGSAVAAAKSFRPDVVLLDVGLPVMSGIDVAREIRNHPETGHTRLVAMTGWGQAEDRDRTRDAGFDYHLTKPVAADALAGVLHELSL